VFTISVTLGFIFPSIKDLATSRMLPSFMLAGITLYIAGAWLKHLPLYTRLAFFADKKPVIWYMLFLLVGHFVIMFTALIFSEPILGKIFGFPVDIVGKPNGYRLFIEILLSGFFTWVVYRSGNKKRLVYNKVYMFRRELIADMLLIAGVGVLSFIFWEKTIFEGMSTMPIHSFGDAFGRFVLITICYGLLYLPLRYLYLVEDHSTGAVGKRLLLITLLVLVRGVLAAL
jgi:hypothetical protein